MILTLAAFAQLAAACGPSVHVSTLAAVAKAESKFNTLAIGDNSSGRSYRPATSEEAEALAASLIREGHSIDLGLMQVNSKNLRGLGLSIADAFDACKSIAAGARVLVDGYHAPGDGSDPQPALLRALSHYNTGSPVRGFTNGYVRRVQYAAQQVVPAIRVDASAAAPLGQEGGSGQVASPPPPPAPPSWDVFATARYRRDHAEVATLAPVIQPSPASLPAAPVQAPPVTLQAVASAEPDVR
ncbi:lytic transglycosylase domain-containing protein [Methylobacterium radiotolerans]|uniref:lytic transglycosylase domain-containing protein n=1 Tax=Methylobacterium radiotolerans TaxID=31998 RepID=UPI000977125B|nr:lytic transglycosylase domain-containing protein [Methylobacterium radiotolerans]